MADFVFWTLVADFIFWTQVADFAFWMLVTNFGFWTPVADFVFWTPVADFVFWTPVADFVVWTLVADFGFWTLAADLGRFACDYRLQHYLLRSFYNLCILISVAKCSLKLPSFCSMQPEIKNVTVLSNEGCHQHRGTSNT